MQKPTSSLSEVDQDVLNVFFKSEEFAETVADLPVAQILAEMKKFRVLRTNAGGEDEAFPIAVIESCPGRMADRYFYLINGEIYPTPIMSRCIEDKLIKASWRIQATREEYAQITKQSQAEAAKLDRENGVGSGRSISHDSWRQVFTRMAADDP